MFYGISWVEWFGYAASVVVAISLTMSSIIKLRWLNLTGSLMFSGYGFIIGSYPVSFFFFFFSVINVLYLSRMYREKDDFQVMAWSGNPEYLDYFLDFHRKDIARFFPRFDFAARDGWTVFFLIQNAAPIGLLIGREQPDRSFRIELDYVGPQFRDFRMGSFLYEQNDFFRQRGYASLTSVANGGAHDEYLTRMGFSRSGSDFVKVL